MIDDSSHHQNFTNNKSRSGRLTRSKSSEAIFREVRHHKPQSELWEASYEMGEFLGFQGRFSKLYKCFDRPAGKDRTVKIILRSRWSSKKNGTNNNNKIHQQHPQPPIPNPIPMNRVKSDETSSMILESSTATTTGNKNSSSASESASASDLQYLNHYNRNHLQEFTILRTLQHPHILKVYELLQDTHNYYMISDYYHPHQTLKSHLVEQGPFSEADAGSILAQILSCLDYIHQRHIIHCNLRLKSFTITNQKTHSNDKFEIKLKDVHNAVVLTQLGEETPPQQQSMSANKNNLRLMEPRGNLRYMAPEVISIDKSYGPLSDIWSTGVIAYAMLSGTLPFDGETYKDIQTQIIETLQQQHWIIDKFRNQQDPTIGSTSDSCKHFISRLLEAHESNRPTAQEALTHPWITPFVVGNFVAATDKSTTSAPPDHRPALSMIQEQLSDKALLPINPDSPPQLLQKQEQEYALATFVEAYDLIQIEYQAMHELLNSHQVITTTNNGYLMMTELDISKAYQLLFQQELPQEKLEGFLHHFGSSVDDNENGTATMMMEEPKFIVAIMNEKGLLFTRPLQDAFNVFDQYQTGLVESYTLEQALETYVQQLSTTPAISSDSTEDKVAEILRQVRRNLYSFGDYNELTMEGFVAVLLEAAIPRNNEVDTDGATFSDLCIASTGSLSSCVSQQGSSVVSELTQPRQASIFDMLSLNVSAKHFITQQPGRQISLYYNLNEFANKGACGAVWFCTHKETGAERAVKLVRKSPSDMEYNHSIKDEFFMLRELDHPNILQQYAIFEDENYFYILMDAARGGDLCDELDQYGAFVELEAARLMKQLLGGLNYLHCRGIVHCDIKPENILLEENMELSQLKIIDFGFAEKIESTPDQRIKTRHGTLYYSAPEVFAVNYGAKADIWSAGVICFLLLSDGFPFSGSTTEETIQQIESGKYSFDSEGWADISDIAKDFVSRLLTVDEDKRPTAEEALRHPWIEQVDSEMAEELTPAMLLSTVSNLVSFSAENKFKQIICIFIASQILTKDDKEVVDKAFHIFDKDCRGCLSRDAIRVALQNYAGIEPTEDELDGIFQRLDMAGTNSIEYTEFVMAAIGMDVLLSFENLRKAFNCFDTDGSGVITKENLKMVLGAALEEWKEFEDDILGQLLAQAATDSSEGISFEDFTRILINQ